jgi:signal transduction histidine kinase/ActR/RegA family two-component response regulator
LVIGSDLSSCLEKSCWEKILTVLSGSHPIVKIEDFLTRRDGGDLPIHLAASQLPLPNQRVICLVVTDLSQQKSGDALRLAKEIAERANAAKDDFLATLSHELRTPLNPALLGIANLQQDDRLSPEVQSTLAMVRRNIELETRLIDDLLDLTRIANGKFELHEGPVDISLILGRVVDICRGSIEAKHLRLCLDFSAEETHSFGDEVRLQQVFWNVLRNAIKFTPAGGCIQLSTANPDADHIRISIADTGIGFSPEQEPLLFNAFEQVTRDITRRFGGLGLGLSIGRSLILAHGGRIWGESSGPGQGATFHIQLPLRAPSVTSPKPASEHQQDSVSNLKILLIEDHEDTRNVFHLILSARGHRVHAVETAQDALAIAEAQAFDMVISDLGLPDLSGIELMKQLREKYGLPGIAVSGYGMEDDIARSREAGFRYHLTKPFDPARLDELIAAMGRELHRRS